MHVAYKQCLLLALFGSATFGDRGPLSAPKRTPASRQRPRLWGHGLGPQRAPARRRPQAPWPLLREARGWRN